MLFRTLLPLIALTLASCAGGPENLFVPVSATAEGPRFEAPRRRKLERAVFGLNRGGIERSRYRGGGGGRGV